MLFLWLNIRENRHSFLSIIPRFPWIFFQLIERESTNPDAYEFIAPEIKQRSFRLDGLFTTTEEYSDLPLFFVEVQFYQETNFYDRLFPSIFLYFSQYKPVNSNWYAIVIFDKESNDVAIPSRYREIAETRLQRIYLDRVSGAEQSNLGVGILKLVVEPKNNAGELARNLITRTEQEVLNTQTQKQLQELIETIIIYKFPNLSYEEIETMLNLQEIKQTRVYQDAKSEGKLEQKIEMIPLLQELGLSVKQIAQKLEIEEEIVRSYLE